ncbi:LacI family DNA-binding transcriptional regulator [Vibrio sp. FNV 38]|nr:LacI family DNA-binding transcriptional regulator [Vibrio sp. FNV 38]
MPPPQNRFVSAQQVADLAGVSRSAVSRTFTDGASVSPKTRDKVLIAAEQLGYHVNHLARGLHTSSNIICLITTDISTPFQSRFIDNLTRQLQQINKVAMIINTKGDKQLVSHALTQTLNFRAEASIILSGQPDNGLIERCISNGQRVLMVNRDYQNSSAELIRYDAIQAAQQVVELFTSQNCKRLLIINSDVHSSSLRGRQEAVLKVAKEKGLSTKVVRFGDTSYNSGDHMSLEYTKDIDGVFCVTDLLACGFLDGLRKQSVCVPEDTIVVGFDDIEQASWDSYQLTTFSQPVETICAHIIERLQAEPTDLENEWVYSVQPILRKTTKH